ncbi:hypothetical protein [Mesorhizobium sp. INR15]|uniref:hypothetical protein n=1 Tax=Mesorhizobium sp. INR15 TaxID=2654248 RepID=UPI00189680AF|nr:hypothetical protein [Mesorhizobium sp. INR15]QPC93579.1 hypothetical protein GA829_25040 [Mesorhizobium sp. INR15]
MFGVIAVVAAFGLDGGAGHPPTAEETVAYFAHGLEQGVHPRYGQQIEEPLKRVSRSPAIFTSTGKGEVGDKLETLRFIITRLDDCTYSAEQQYEEDGKIYFRLTYKLQLGAVTSFVSSNAPEYVELKGLMKECTTDTDGACDLTREPENIGPFFGAPDKADQALAYFHEKFCPLKR